MTPGQKRRHKRRRGQQRQRKRRLHVNVSTLVFDQNKYDIKKENGVIVITTERCEAERRKRHHEWDKDVVFEVKRIHSDYFSTTEYLTQQGEEVYDPSKSYIVTRNGSTYRYTDHGGLSATLHLLVKFPPLIPP